MKPTADDTDAPTPEQIEAAAQAEAEFNSKLVELIAEGKTDEEAREILGSIVPDRRAPLDEPQLIALADAEATGALPEIDRRAAEKPSLPDVSLDPSFPATEPEVGAGTTDPIEFPEPETPAEPEIPEQYHQRFHRIHDIFDHLVKQIDPVERIMLHELRQILEDLGIKRPK